MAFLWFRFAGAVHTRISRKGGTPGPLQASWLGINRRGRARGGPGEAGAGSRDASERLSSSSPNPEGPKRVQMITSSRVARRSRWKKLRGMA
jgi:hypothetical protein